MSKEIEENIIKLKNNITALFSARKFNINFDDDSEIPRSIIGLISGIISVITLAVGFGSPIPAGIIMGVVCYFCWTIERTDTTK